MKKAKHVHLQQTKSHLAITAKHDRVCGKSCTNSGLPIQTAARMSFKIAQGH